MCARTWNLRMNLDEFNAVVAGLYVDKDRALALQGLSLGCNGGICSEDAPAPLRMAWEVAIAWRQEADGYKAKKSKAGQASAASRAALYGTAQPARTTPEQCSNGVQTTPEPIHNPQSVLLLRSEHTGHDQEKTASGPLVDPVLLALPCHKGKLYHITQGTLGRWKETFPELDLLDEAKRMKFWLEENPTRQKTFQGMGKFISCWLGNAQDRIKNQKPGHPSPPAAKSQMVADYIADNRNFFRGSDDVPSE